MERLRRRPRSDESGAAAVEFALLFPLFAMLVFGIITAGVALFEKIALTQSSREGARFGATDPISLASSSNWLDAVSEVVLSDNGWTSSALTDSGWVCVAYVQASPSTASWDKDVVTTRKTWGTLPSGLTLPSDGSCVADGRTDDRVQAVAYRKASLNFVLFAPEIYMSGSSVTRFERTSS